jgi:Zinc-binding dehydrogenase
LLGGTDRQIRAQLLSPFIRQQLGTFVAVENAGDLIALTRLIESGQVAPAIERVYPLTEVATAIRHMLDGRACGQARGRPPDRWRAAAVEPASYRRCDGSLRGGGIMRMRTAGSLMLFSLVGVLGVGAVPGWAAMTQGAYTEQVSVTTAGEPVMSSGYGVAVNADGRFAAFLSRDEKLLGPYPPDMLPGFGLFVRDRKAGTTTRADLGADGRPVLSGAGVDDVSMDADGRKVAFVDEADLLGDGQGYRQRVFVRDLRAGRTSRVDVSSQGVSANGASMNPQISADGRFVAFDSFATNLVPSVTNGVSNVYVRDLRTRTTTLVSVALGGAQPDGISRVPAISADGRFVAFASAASNLVPGDDNASSDLFVRDLRKGTTTMALKSTRYNAGGYDASISADGRYVAFQDFGQLKVYDQRTRTTRTLAPSTSDGAPITDAATPSISANGRYVAFEGRSGGGILQGTAYRYDLRTNHTESAMVSSDGQPLTGDSRDLAISADGRSVIFTLYSVDVTTLLHHFAG